MQAEDLLIQSCTRVHTDPNAAGKIKEILSPHLNWAYFFERAGSGGIVSLVYSSLSKIDDVKSTVPEDIWERLEGSYYTIAARNISLSQKLNTLLKSFNEAGIDAILLKGMALIHTIYPDIALRPMYDIDILIHKKDFPLAESKLKELGYNNSVFYPEDFHKDDMMIDVHWELLNVTRVKSRKKSYCINIDEVWNNSIPIEINGQKIRILSPEYCLMDLCLHLTFHHGLQGLMWFIDIIKLMEYYKNEMDWNKFIKKSFECKINKPIYYVFFYIKNVLGQDMPQFILDGLRPKRQNYLERKIFDLIVSDAPLENIKYFFAFSNMETFFDRLIFLKEIILPSTKVLSARYNITSRRYIPQYYLIHFKSISSSILKLLKNASLKSF